MSIGEEDRDSLFRRAMDNLGVRPANLAGGRTTERPVAAAPSRRERRYPAASEKTPAPPAIDRTNPDDTVLFVRAGVDRTRWKALRRGQVALDESIDLHGLRSHEVEAALERFVTECRAEGLASLLIIHGKGRGSEIRGGILKPMTIGWLRRQAVVMAFCEAQPADGGHGALYVLLSAN